MCWPSVEAMPSWAASSSLRQGSCIPVTYVAEDTDSFLAGFYAAAEFAYDRLFWPLLGSDLYEDAIWTPEPMEI